MNSALMFGSLSLYDIQNDFTFHPLEAATKKIVIKKSDPSIYSKNALFILDDVIDSNRSANRILGAPGSHHGFSAPVYLQTGIH